MIEPAEAWPNNLVSVSAEVRNWGNSEGKLFVDLLIDGKKSETKTVQLPPQGSDKVEFTVNARDVGNYSVELKPAGGTFVRKSLQGFLAVAPNGYHTLAVAAGPVSGNAVADNVEVLLDGKSHMMPYSVLLPVGYHTVEVPETDPTGVYTFCNWEDGSGDVRRRVNLNSLVVATAYYSGNGSSCPSLYMWNGSSDVYVGDVSNHGWLGYINYINKDGSIIFYRNNPWDYIPLDSSQLQATNGSYNLTLKQRWNEIFYLDQAHMVVVDHPANVSVYSTMVEQYLDPKYMGNIYTVTKKPLAPVSAVNEKGESVLSKIAEIDDVFTTGTHGIQSPAWNNITWNKLTLNLGNLTGSQQIKLVVRAVVDWGSPEKYTTWLDKFFAQPVPDGTQVTPPPYMEVKDARGNWIRIPESRQIPLPPDGVPRTYVVDLTGLFPTEDYSLRICNFWNVTYDYIAVDITPQQRINFQEIEPQAYLCEAFAAGSRAATGNFTRYGNVTQLILKEDDMFVIGRRGDTVSLQFPAGNLKPAPAGMVRDYFLYEACWFKDESGNWGFGFGFTVDPLPFKNMTGFPYPPEEAYPDDPGHQNYQLQWNTRTIEVEMALQTGLSGQEISPPNAIPTLALLMLAVYVDIKRRTCSRQLKTKSIPAKKAKVWPLKRSAK